jgi:hypothetical protein
MDSSRTPEYDDARSPLHDLIEDLEPLGIMTFNYDLGHENAYRARRPERHRMRRAIYSDERKLRAVLTDDFRSRFLLKAHGCISRPKTIVLDRASYREVMARQPGYRAFAHHVLARFSALIWTDKAALLESVCREVDRRSEEDVISREAPRAQKYLDALLARWRATRS